MQTTPGSSDAPSAMTAFDSLQRDPGDMEAFDQWYREEYRQLFVFAFRITGGDRALAEDLCHDAILAFVTRDHIKNVRDVSQARRYLRQSISNAHIDVIRSKKREEASRSVSESETDDVGEASAAAQDAYHQLLMELDSDDQEILGMMFAGASLSEVATAMRISYSNAGVKVYRIRNKINDLMEN